MVDKISVFGTPMNTPRAWQPGPGPLPGAGFPQRFFALTMVLTLLASTLGLAFYWDSQQDGGGDQGPFLPERDAAKYIKPLMSERMLTSADLVRYDACSDLERDLKDHIYDEMLVNLATYNYWWRGGWFEDGVVYATPNLDGAESGGTAPTANQKSSQRIEGEDFSGTNNQEQGVDEADFLKTDGYHIYLINGQRLELFTVPEFGQLAHNATLALEGYPTEMLLANDFLVVFSTVNAYNLPEGNPLRALVATDLELSYWRTSSLIKVTVIDVADPDAPDVMREVYLEGYYKTAREVAGTVRMVSYGYLDVHGLKYYVELPNEYWQLAYDDPAREAIYNASLQETLAFNRQVLDTLTLEDLVPRIYQRTPGGALEPYSLTSQTCEDFIVARDSTSHGFTSIFTLDLFGDTFAFDADHIMSNWAEVYASQKVLLIAESAQDSWWFWDNGDYLEATNIHAFDISEPGRTRYMGSGRVNGTVNDQFSLSEYQGMLRIATTSGQWGRWWLSPEERTGPENHVWVLAPAQTQPGHHYLAQLGHVGGIAPGERLWSSRFVGDKGYLVTFRNMDPLWTVDLSNPTDPRVIGELEVPGVSTYIHPMDEDHLLTIGIGPGPEGNGLDWRVTQLSQFDVTDFGEPVLLDTLPLTPVIDDGSQGWTWSYSEATYEHKAFQYWEPLHLLAVPLSTYRSWYDEANHHYHNDYVSKLILVNAAPGGQLSVYGELDHSGFYQQETDQGYSWYNHNFNIRRSIFMGDFIYAVSEGGITVHDLTDMSLETSIRLDPAWEQDIYYDVVAVDGEK